MNTNWSSGIRLVKMYVTKATVSGDEVKRFPLLKTKRSPMKISKNDQRWLQRKSPTDFKTTDISPGGDVDVVDVLILGKPFVDLHDQNWNVEDALGADYHSRENDKRFQLFVHTPPT